MGHDEFKPYLSPYRQVGMCGTFSVRKDCWDWCDLADSHDGEHHFRSATWRERRRRRRQLKRERGYY